ncbi:MAG: dihydrofolate reductase family protein [Streptomyces sp.]
MRALTYYVGATLDGFIADSDGQYGFLPVEPDVMEAMNAQHPETVPVQARGHFGLTDVANKRFDTVLMGRTTFEPALRAGITSPYSHLRQCVFSRTLGPVDPEVEIISSDPVPFVRDLKRQDGMDIWLCGGGRLAGALLGEIDELIVKRYPLVIGNGIPLFTGPCDLAAFAPTTSRRFESGVDVTAYTKR